MINALQIEQMSKHEKLQAMEAIWADLSRNDTEVQSPAWHETVLRETEARAAAGEEQAVDWDKAKRDLRKRYE